MDADAAIWDRDMFVRRCGNFYARGAGHTLTEDKVPIGLRHLIPYAEFWGVTDDLDRGRLVDEAPDNVRDNLKCVMKAHENELYEWLGGPEADTMPPSKEYVAFSALGMAADW